jgi:energy-coupling factor transport system substrate-specific component
MLACTLADVQATAGLTLLVAVTAVIFMLASFEASRPALRQLMPTVVLAATAAVGRCMFAPFADIKPVSAICIVAGAALGRRCGFATGALAALSSNFLFGQGPWTPWQMYAWGLVGYLAGVLQDAGLLRGRGVYVYGFASGLLYGLLMNSWHVLGFVRPLTWPMALAAFGAGAPLDVVHGLATVAFLALIWKPWRRSLERVVRKYALG